MGKKFVNLPSNYRSFLDSIKTVLDQNIIKNIANSEIGFEDINSLHLQIEELGESFNCSSYDINKMINYYDKENFIIEILKKISSTRNKLIVYYAKNSNLWLENLNEIKLKLKKVREIEQDLNNIENAFIKILKKYKYDWDGLWSMIEISKKGKIKNICIFDYNDYIELFEKLS